MDWKNVWLWNNCILWFSGRLKPSRKGSCFDMCWYQFLIHQLSITCGLLACYSSSYVFNSLPSSRPLHTLLLVRYFYGVCVVNSLFSIVLSITYLLVIRHRGTQTDDCWVWTDLNCASTGQVTDTYRTKVIWNGQRAGPRLNIKDRLSRYGDSHVKDKTAGRTSYL